MTVSGLERLMVQQFEGYRWVSLLFDYRLWSAPVAETPRKSSGSRP
jgi:hypothetical protein